MQSCLRNNFAATVADYITLTIQDLNFTIKIIARGYSHLLQVSGEEKQLFFEPDDEGSYRLIRMPDQTEKYFQNLDTSLIKEIISVLNKINV